MGNPAGDGRKQKEKRFKKEQSRLIAKAIAAQASTAKSK